MTRQKVPASGVPTGLPSNTMVVLPMDQRRIADIAVTNDPANVRCRPEHITGVNMA